jgi:hypothetical protein
MHLAGYLGRQEPPQLGRVTIDSQAYSRSGRLWRPRELEEVPMSIVGGLDIHRKQLTFDYLDTASGPLSVKLKWHQGRTSPFEIQQGETGLPRQ